MNPALLFVSDQRLEQAQTLLKQYRERTLPAGTSDEELWEAKKSELTDLICCQVSTSPFLSVRSP